MWPAKRCNAVLPFPEPPPPRTEYKNIMGDAQCPIIERTASGDEDKWPREGESSHECDQQCYVVGLLPYPETPLHPEYGNHLVDTPLHPEYGNHLVDTQRPIKGRFKTSEEDEGKWSSEGKSAQKCPAKRYNAHNSSQIENMEDNNDCTVVKGTNEFSSKHFSITASDPFSHAKPKCPDKRARYSTQDTIEAVKDPTHMERESVIAEQTSLGNRKEYDANSLMGGPRLWKHNGFNQPSLHKTETNGHPNDETDSRCHTILKEAPSPMETGKDEPIKETPAITKSILQENQQAAVQLKSHEGNHFSTEISSSNLRWTIKNKRGPESCSSFLVLLQTFLQMIIALTIILAGCPAIVAGTAITERLTLQAGKPGVVVFYFSWPTDRTSQISPYFTLRFESKQRPFWINGDGDINGFKSISQFSRFTTSVTNSITSSCVNLTIEPVDTLDEDKYILTALLHGTHDVSQEILKKEILVQNPPGPARCFITLSGINNYPYEVHCRATTGDVDTTLTCYQHNHKIGVKGDITDNDLVTKAIFLLPDNSHFACCSHGVNIIVSETICNDFVWASDIRGFFRSSEAVTRDSKLVNNSVTTVIKQSEHTSITKIEAEIESGARRQFALPLLWRVTYMLTYVVYLVLTY